MFPSFVELAKRHLDPVLEQAGFAAGQWGFQPPLSEHTTFSVLFCAGRREYANRYPGLDAGPDLVVNPSECIDIVVEGSQAGLVRCDVEFESLADLLGRIGLPAARRRVADALRQDDLDKAFGDLASVLAEVYGEGVRR